MARGFSFVKRASAEQAARGGSSLWGGKLIFKLPEDGDTAVVRFIPDEDGEYIFASWHHEIPVEGRAWGNLVPCIAQDEDGNHTNDDCPGCEADLPMKFKGYVRMIWRDGPVYKTDEKGAIVKDNLGDPVVLDHKDAVAIWSSGPRVFEELDETHEAYKDLGSRDFRVKRRGVKKDTKYTIVPAIVDGGPKKMSAADKKLVEADETDLNDFIRAPSYDDWQVRLTGVATTAANGGSSGAGEAARSGSTPNPFKRSQE